MYTIIRGRESGKAHEVLELARNNAAIVVTPDSRAFRVKAHNYGFDDVLIMSYQDLQTGIVPEKPLILHNLDKAINDIMQISYGIEVPIIGFSATES